MGRPLKRLADVRGNGHQDLSRAMRCPYEQPGPRSKPWWKRHYARRLRRVLRDIDRTGADR